MSTKITTNPVTDITRAFVNQEFGTLRIIVEGDEIWFVGRDVASALGYKKPGNALLAHVDIEDKKYVPIQNVRGGVQNMTVINEPGLYGLIMSSKLQSAKKFKRWVMSEMLPSVRKIGNCTIGQDEMSDEELLQQAFLLTCNQVKLRDEEIEKLKLKVEELDKRIEKLEVGSRSFSENVSARDNRTLFGSLMKKLAHANFGGLYGCAYNAFYKELLHQKGMALKNRRGNGSYISRVKEHEWNDVIEVVTAMCERVGAVSKVNTKRAVSK